MGWVKKVTCLLSIGLVLPSHAATHEMKRVNVGERNPHQKNMRTALETLKNEGNAVASRITDPEKRQQFQSAVSALDALKSKMESSDPKARAEAAKQAAEHLLAIRDASSPFRSKMGSEMDVFDTLLDNSASAGVFSRDGITVDEKRKEFLSSLGSTDLKADQALARIPKHILNAKALEYKPLIKNLGVVEAEHFDYFTKVAVPLMADVIRAGTDKSSPSRMASALGLKGTPTKTQAEAVKKLMDSLFDGKSLDREKLGRVVAAIRAGEYGAVTSRYQAPSNQSVAGNLASSVLAGKVGDAKVRADAEAAIQSWAERVMADGETPVTQAVARAAADEAVRAWQGIQGLKINDNLKKRMLADLFRSSPTVDALKTKSQSLIGAAKNGQVEAVEGLATLGAAFGHQYDKLRKEGKSHKEAEAEATRRMAEFFVHKLAYSEKPDAYGKHSKISPEEIGDFLKTYSKMSPEDKAKIDLHLDAKKRKELEDLLCKCAGQCKKAA